MKNTILNLVAFFGVFNVISNVCLIGFMVISWNKFNGELGKYGKIALFSFCVYVSCFCGYMTIDIIKNVLIKVM